MDFLNAKTYITEELKSGLSPKLTYHGLHHTLDVLQVTTVLCEKEQIDHHYTLLLQTAALYHDTGFLRSYQQHEQHSCDIAQETLPFFGYQPAHITLICDFILATRIPQNPRNAWAALLCDADLDYLGRPDFYAIGQTLRDELLAYHVIQSEEEWDMMQIQFLQEHQYFTPTNQQHREGQKQAYLHELLKVIQGNITS